MSKPKVFVTCVICDKGLNLVKEFCEAEIWPEELPPSREALLEKVHSRCRDQNGCYLMKIGLDTPGLDMSR